MDFDLGFFDDAPRLESQIMPTVRVLRQSLKNEFKKATKREHIAEFLTEIPPPGTALHIIGNGKYDFWTWIPHILGLLGSAPVEFYGSTWTLNRANCEEMLGLFDAGRLAKISFLTGTYFKRRESAVYATLVTGLMDRGQRFACFENHAKVALIAEPTSGTYLAIEGSANFTANPRMEQYCIFHDRAVHDFHREWFEEVLTSGAA